jgi:hypothetical protein
MAGHITPRTRDRILEKTNKIIEWGNSYITKFNDDLAPRHITARLFNYVIAQLGFTKGNPERNTKTADFVKPFIK